MGEVYLRLKQIDLNKENIFKTLRHEADAMQIQESFPYGPQQSRG